MNVTKKENIVAPIIDLIEKNLDRFPALRQVRTNAFENFKQLGLPGNKHEEYRHTPLTRALEKNFTLNNVQAAAQGNVNVENHFIPDLNEDRIVFINGTFSREHSSADLPNGIQVRLLSELINDDPAIVTSYLSNFADYQTDAFTAWNTAAWTYGVFVHIPAKTIVEKPLVVYHITDATTGEQINTCRNLILAEKGSEATIILKNNSQGTNAHFTNTVTEVIVKENAGINLYTIQTDKGNTFEFNQTTVCQENNSRINCYTFTLDGKLVRNNLQLLLDGEGCDSHMYGLYLLDNDTLADNHTVADHRKPNSFSNELYKGIMNGRSNGVFNGKIYVRPHAQKTNAFQANRNIILTDEAGVNTKPQLEIWADDVKCSHGCTSGQLDEEALFYLRARGINKDTAKGMLLYAFAEEVVNAVKHSAIKTYLDKLISERLNKNFEV